jgi:site-specific DNA recombinase
MIDDSLRGLDIPGLTNAPGTRTEAAVMRGLIEKIVLTPREGMPMAAELHGDLAAILAFSDREERRAKANRPPLGSDGRLSLVAGARNHLYRTQLHWKRSKIV